MSKKDKVSALSLFTGCGGLDVGIHDAGVSVAAAIEFDKDSIKTLGLNEQFASTKLLLSDVKAVRKRDLKKLVPKGGKLIVVGGPPCQPFSKAGYWVGNKQRKGKDDPRNMIGEYFRVVKDLKPNGFIFENVESLLHPTNKSTVEEVLQVATKLGYKTLLFRANALDYGVPQKRKRIFIIGSRKGFKTGDAPIKTHADPKVAKSLALLPHESVGKHLKGFEGSKYKEREESFEGKTYANDLKEVPPGKNYMALTHKYQKGTRFWSFLLKLDPKMPSWTIAAQPGPWVGPFHWENRRLRVPEIAAIQTFPKGYKFFGTRRSVQRQIGNAVPPKMAKAMAEFLLRNI